MSGRIRAFFISLSILALLLFSAFGTIPVYADDGTATGTTDTNTTTPTEQEVTPTAAPTDPGITTPSNPGTVVATPTDQAVVTTTTDQTTSDPAPSTDPVTASDGQQPPAPIDGTTTTADPQPEAAAVPLLEQLPDNTTVTVVDAAGDPQPLASQSSANAVLLSDPIWCPAGQSPTPGANGCTGSFTNFTDLLNYLHDNQADYQGDGTIFVQQGAYTGPETTINFNNFDVPNLQQHNLTITGGWNTSDNSVSTSGSQFTAPIILGSSSSPWGGSLTLNNIFISGVSDQAGLTLISQSDVNLNNVEVTNSQSGAEINAGGNVTIKDSNFHHNKQKGADITSGGSVDISHSQFSDNGSGNIGDPTGSGLGVNSTGSVTLLDVMANNNQLFGADINAGSSVLIQQSVFNGNLSYHWFNTKTYYGTGLQVVTPADIALLNVSADGNYVLGAYLQASDIAIRDSSFSNNGTPSDLDVVGKGLEIVGITTPNWGNGNVALRNVVANNNEEFGANILTTGNVAINTDAGKTSSFSGQLTTTYDYDTGTGLVSNIGGGYGLQVVAGGDIDLRGVTATQNYLYGTNLNGLNVNITDSTFNNNGSGVNTQPTGYGLKINSGSAVTLANVAANNNQLFGADILAVGTVSITTGFFSGTQSIVYDPCSGIDFKGYGLTVVSKTADILLDGVTANFNNLWGASLEGYYISVVNSQFNNNISDSTQFIDDTGLIITQHGTGDSNYVFVNNTEALNNRLIGATIKADGDVYVFNSNFNGNQGVTCSLAWCPAGSQTYHGYGLNVETPGLIYLYGVNASNNNLFGANLQGSTITVENSTFSNNVYGSGLIVNATGPVTLTNVTAANNGVNGAEVNSTGSCVAVIGGAFTGNAQYGLSVSGAPLSLDGTQTFGGNGSGDYQGTVGVCMVLVTAQSNHMPGTNIGTPPTNPVPVVLPGTSNSTSTTVGSGTTTSNTKVTNVNKHTKAVKKAVVRKHKRHAVVQVERVRHARRWR